MYIFWKIIPKSIISVIRFRIIISRKKYVRHYKHIDDGDLSGG